MLESLDDHVKQRRRSRGLIRISNEFHCFHAVLESSLAEECQRLFSFQYLLEWHVLAEPLPA